MVLCYILSKERFNQDCPWYVRPACRRAGLNKLVEVAEILYPSPASDTMDALNNPARPFFHALRVGAVGSPHLRAFLRQRSDHAADLYGRNLKHNSFDASARALQAPTMGG